MTRLEQVINGLTIISTQNDPDICAEHDCIYAMYDCPWNTDYELTETLTPGQIKALEDLGWINDGGIGHWKYFV